MIVVSQYNKDCCSIFLNVKYLSLGNILRKLSFINYIWDFLRKALFARKVNRKSQKWFPIVKMIENHCWNMCIHQIFHFNPFALRRAKTPCFGPFECNRVKVS